MKRALLIGSILVVLAFVLSACGGSNKKNITDQPASSVNVVTVSVDAELTETYNDTEGRIGSSVMIDAIAPCKGELSQDRNAIYYTAGCQVVFSRGIRIEPIKPEGR